MFSLQVIVTLLCLLCLTNAALGLECTAEIKRQVNTLQKEKQDIAKKYVLARSFKTKILDKGSELVDQMRALVAEYGIDEEFSSVAEFVDNLAMFLEETKDLTDGQTNRLVEEFEDTEYKIQLLLLKLLESTP